MQRSLSDRREKARFDIVGELHGAMQAVLSLPIRDVGRGGAQVESRVPLPTDSVHWVSFGNGVQDTSVQVRVRHGRPVADAGEEPRYLLGLEFLSPTPALLEMIDQWLVEPGAASGVTPVES